MENMSPMETAPLGTHASLQEKYLTFRINSEEFALEIEGIREIIRVPAITKIPNLPKYIRGAANLRGQVVPTIELRAKFGLPTVEDSVRTCIIIVEIGDEDHKIPMGLVVDEVAEVLEIPSGMVDTAMNFGGAISSEYLKGVGVVGGKVILILNANEVVNHQELALLQEIEA